MPIHDWTRVSAGTVHAFHVGWVGRLQDALNLGRLPAGYYALAEQDAGPYEPDVLTLRSDDPEDVPPAAGGAATLTARPLSTLRAPVIDPLEPDPYATRRNRIAIRHSSEDQVIALIEIVSPGNKNSREGMRRFLEKAADSLARGLHLLIVDLHPPGSRDPHGIHAALREEIGLAPFTPPAGQPLTVAGYVGGRTHTAYVYPLAVGDELPPGPLPLTLEEYVEVPLEATYLEAYRGMPYRWRRVLDAPPAS